MRDKWIINKISDFGEIITGSTPSTKNSEYWFGEFPFYSPADFKGNVWCELTERNLTEKGMNTGRIIPEKSILMTCIGSIGKIAIAKHKGISNQQINAIIANENFDFKFIYYLLTKNKNKFVQSAPMTTIQIINKSDFSNFEFLTPPLPQQRKIAQILSTCDTVIEKTEAAIAKYQAIKQGMMHDLFTRGIDLSTGKLRPKNEDAPELYKESELGMIPKEWEVKRLEELIVTKPNYGINAPAVEFNSNYPTYLRITDIDDEGRFSEIGRKSVDHPFSKNYLLKHGDIVFARTGATVGKTFLYNNNEGKLVYAGFLIKVSPDPDLLVSKFLKYFTETNFYKNWILIMCQRSGQPGVNGNEYSKLPLPTPKYQEQKEVTGKINSISQKIKTEQSTLSKYRQIKMGLMQDLLSGKVEVKVNEKEFEIE